jgi:RNA polymerase sigma factor (sigma-70 family)
MTDISAPVQASYSGLFARAKAGDQDAWKLLFEQVSPKIIRVIRRRLTSSALRSLYDSSDFANDVWQSIASKPERFDFESLEAFVAYFTLAVQRKVIDEYRRMHTLKNAIDRNCPGDGLEQTGRYIASSDPTPSQYAQASESLQRIHNGLTPTESRIVTLRQEGHGTDDIAEMVGWSVRRVQRFLQDLKSDLGYRTERET